ncbi:MAG: hypothetical protein JW828_10075, partial [Sedimentisphaerales bacterium]|nr:hypothetical protein [Sedimentisphaerales bacterium]
MGGMGGMGGGMGGMGGGMMGGMGGMGGGMMGGMGGGMYGGGGYTQMQARMRAYEIIYIVQETIEPDSWYDAGGEGRINEFGGNQLIIWQTPEIHARIRDFLDRMMALLGQQVAVEARFLLVDEHFLEDIGLDVTINTLRMNNWQLGTASDPTSVIEMDSFEASRPSNTDVSGSLATLAASNPALNFGLSYTGAIDDLQVDFIIRATQMHSNSKTLTAPKATVMNGESTMISVNTVTNYKSDSEIESETITTTGTDRTFTYWTHEIDQISDGINMMVTPVITADKKYVILNIETMLNDVTFTQDTVQAVDPGTGTLLTDTYDLPVNQISQITTRVMVPDQGTVLLGGLTITADAEIESGIPGLSKLPILGRLFSNRSDIKDKRILLILVKPSIILKEEAEADAVAAIEASGG